MQRLKKVIFLNRLKKIINWVRNDCFPKITFNVITSTTQQTGIGITYLFILRKQITVNLRKAMIYNDNL